MTKSKKLSRLDVSVLNSPKNRFGYEHITGILKSQNIRIVDRLRLAELLISSDFMNEFEILTARRPVQHDFSTLPWYKRYFVRRNHLAEIAQFNLASTLKEVLKFSRDVRAWESASGNEFEKLVAYVFRSSGFKVEEVGGAGDGGIDLIAEKNRKSYIIQCKAHSKRVSPGSVRDFYGALVNSPSRTGIFATKFGVSNNARLWAKDKPIIFMQIDDFIARKHSIFL